MEEIKLLGPRTFFTFESNREGTNEIELGDFVLHINRERVENFNNF